MEENASISSLTGLANLIVLKKLFYSKNKKTFI